MAEKKQDPKRKLRPFRIWLRYKLAFPVLVLLTLILGILYRTTSGTVQELVLERNEGRLTAIAEVFAETVKVPLILNNQQVLLANIEWMAKRDDVLEVRVEDSEGVIMGGDRPTYASLPSSVIERNFIGVKRVSQDTYAVAVPIRAHDRRLGRVLILFTQQGLEESLANVFADRFSWGFIMAIGLAMLTAILSYIAVKPLGQLKRTAQKILAGDLSARAKINSMDEIQDVAEAFNEMVSRLGTSLDSLRSRTEALEESEAKYRLVVENASDIIFTLTSQSDLVLLNRGFSGCKREELLMDGMNLFIALHDDESKKIFQEAFEEVCKTKQPVTNLAVRHIHRGNQTEIFYLTNLTPVVDNNGEMRFIQGMMRDVTELRRIEMMKESLIRDVAHELKTPTAKFEMAVNWFEKEVGKGKEAKKYEQVIGILKSNTDRLMRTITSIMDLSKLESGMQQREDEELNLNEVLEQVRADMEPICEHKGLSLECFLAHEPLRMRGDRDMLYRLFLNLVGNAAKFTDLGKVTLSSEKENGHIRVAVKDTGPGIEPENLDQVFERFVQKTASSLGIGVGLTISRDIAAMHEGRVWAESEGLGKGATFKVEFPAL